MSHRENDTNCLKNHIVNTSPKEKGTTFNCPVCQRAASPLTPRTPNEKWAEQFLLNPFFLAMSPMGKNKGDRFCDSCLYTGTSYKAKTFCTVCKEALCTSCDKVHRKNKATRNHNILDISQVSTDPELAVSFSGGVTCSDHLDKDIEYYCKGHNVMCCHICSFDKHKGCTDILKISDHVHELLVQNEPQSAADRMQQLEEHLFKYTEINDAVLKKMEKELDEMPKQIYDLRKKFNSALAQLEKRIIIEKNAILREQTSLKNEEKRKCHFLITAIRNSHRHLEAVSKCKKSAHVLITLNKFFEQLDNYEKTVHENFTENVSVEATLHINEQLMVIADMPEIQMGKLEVREYRQSHQVVLPTKLQQMMRVPRNGDSNEQKDNSMYGPDPLKKCKPEIVSKIKTKYPDTRIPAYEELSLLNDGKIMLLDSNTYRCRLYDSSHEHVADYVLSSKPYDVCLVEATKVAVALPQEHKIQFLTIDKGIRPIRNIDTKLQCTGLAALSREQLAVCGLKGDKLCWGTMSVIGKETLLSEICSTIYYDSFLTLNSEKSRVYVSCFDPPAVYCYDLQGKLIFRYENQSLDGATGVGLDKEDNLYVVGSRSHNILQVSPEGNHLQEFTTGIPKYPRAICFDSSGQRFLLTNSNGQESFDVDIFEMKGKPTLKTVFFLT
ncbi:hypothetical protein CHS0354_033967 [Potamilus streckersoni]|uniref:B box-type domain-containing protein n=1 Tax=Potamilus streckersoni TaxID=2493646 RepID=A0AAE0T9E5_9BIVA|nr:hypothetical protein CHS0354_033967 [Potamilus streckersoni]